MITKINKVLSVGLMCCGIAAALTACTDTWDDHYESLGSGNMHEGTLWQAIKSNPNLSNFAKVIEECDYAKNSMAVRCSPFSLLRMTTSAAKRPQL